MVSTPPPSAEAPPTCEPEGPVDDPPPSELAPAPSPAAPTSQPARQEPRDDDDERARLRSAALDLEEAKLRVEREAARAGEQLRGQLLSELLPVLDNLDRSIEAMNQSTDADLHEGLALVRQQFEGVLQSYGVERIDAVGVSFDPARHEAIGVVEVDSHDDDGRVMRECQAGFRFGDRVLRAAKVQVGKLATS